MSEVFFQPFVGKDYQRGGIFGKRIMVLGESHYCDEGCTDATWLIIVSAGRLPMVSSMTISMRTNHANGG